MICPPSSKLSTMPSVASGKVLVTGANGFIAIWVVHTLLQQGYSVRGTVRSEGKAAHLRKTFASHGEKLELAIVPDITKEGAFDDAVRGVDAIAHTASPVTFTADDPDELIIPAVHGTTRVLESTLVHGKAVKRIVFTSSTAAVMQPENPGRTFTEADWNDGAVTEVREKGAAASQHSKYRASKVLAERAAWDFAKRNEGKIQWDLVVLNPPFVFGPVIHETGSEAETLNESMIIWFRNVFRGVLDPTELGKTGSEWIDVRDLAEAHVRAIKINEAGGERILVSQGAAVWQDWINAARKHGAQAPVGDESYDPTQAVHSIRYDASKARRILRLEYRSLQQSTGDIVDDLKSRGWI